MDNIKRWSHHVKTKPIMDAEWAKKIKDLALVIDVDPKVYTYDRDDLKTALSIAASTAKTLNGANTKIKDIISSFEKRELEKLPGPVLAHVLMSIEDLEDDYDSIESYKKDKTDVLPRLHPTRKYDTLNTLGYKKASKTGHIYVVAPGESMNLNMLFHGGKRNVYSEQDSGHYIVGFTNDLIGVLSDHPPLTKLLLAVQCEKEVWKGKVQKGLKELKHNCIIGREYGEWQNVTYYDGNVNEVINVVTQLTACQMR
jgi:hypothetical protein